MTFQSYSWAAGFDDVAGLVNVETDLPSYQGLVVTNAGLGSYDPGIITPKADRLTIARGYQSVEWTFSIMPISVYAYIQSNYTVGGTSHSGKMTIHTTIEDGTFSNFNAYMHLPTQSSLSRVSQGFTGVVIRFTLDGAAS